jgi:spore germination protein GerM
MKPLTRRQTLALLSAAALVQLAGCPAAEPPPPSLPPAAEPAAGPPVAEPESMTVRVYFTRDEQPHAVTREVPRTEAVLRAALEELLRGPTPDEQAAGLFSWFSEETAGMLNRVAVDGEGKAVVDFRDFRATIPNASTSAGSAVLLGELNNTVFQFGSVRSVEYRIDGSCEAFWNFLQRSCGVVQAPDSAAR